MMDYLTLNGANVNRGCYSSAYSAEEVTYETRQLLAQLFHFPKCKNVIFTPQYHHQPEFYPCRIY
ncbi:MAG: hypothetical protein ACLU6Y_03770 [Ruminococcus sp.]